MSKIKWENRKKKWHRGKKKKKMQKISKSYRLQKCKTQEGERRRRTNEK